ncbi:hypothetical protein ACIGXM_13025 [Kitasatospora sp. NPDC052896]|uniref:hypothetical protein n=1 Tax=Kitasatospora sp. NPDC052896 TaxID=3364061 RepID=UPI0037CCA839
MENVDKRNAVRAGAVSAVAALMMLMSSPAFADGGDGSYKGLTVAQSLGLYVGIPIALFVIIAGLVMLPSVINKDKKK